MRVTEKIISFLFPIVIPIGLAIFTAMITLMAKLKEKREATRQIKGRYSYKSDSELFEVQHQFWHEFTLSISFAYISYDIWAYTTIFKSLSIITMKVCTEWITFSLLLHLIYLGYRTYNGTEELSDFRWNKFYKYCNVWFNFFSIVFIFVTNIFLGQ